MLVYSMPAWNLHAVLCMPCSRPACCDFAHTYCMYCTANMLIVLIVKMLTADQGMLS